MDSLTIILCQNFCLRIKITISKWKNKMKLKQKLLIKLLLHINYIYINILLIYKLLHIINKNLLKRHGLQGILNYQDSTVLIYIVY